MNRTFCVFLDPFAPLLIVGARGSLLAAGDDDDDEEEDDPLVAEI